MFGKKKDRPGPATAAGGSSLKAVKTAAAAGLVLGLAACGTTAARTTAHRPSTAAAATSAAAAPASTAMQTDPNGEQCFALDSLGYCPGDDPSPLQQWCNGSGYSDYEQVQSDLQQIGTDTGNNDLGSVESDGVSLFKDASTAVENLSPLSKTHKVEYGVWMGFLALAGGKASQGDLAGAASTMAKATKYNSISIYVSNQCGAS